MPDTRTSVTRLVLLVVIAVLALAVYGCGDGGSQQADVVGEAVQPAPWDLSTPEAAVRSYLDWVSFSYRMANSEIPTATMTPEEGVRVDSYIQLNRIDGKGIEQSLDSFEITAVSQESTSAVVTAREAWRYRYFSLDTLKYVSEEYTASYETTYTLVAEREGWLVDRVEATPEGEVK